MFTARFVNYLQLKKITPYKVAKETGISQGLMNEYKNGVKIPTFQNLAKIADYLGVTTDYLLGRTEHPSVSALSPDEHTLVTDYRSLSAPGQKYIRDTMDFAKNKYNNSSYLHSDTTMQSDEQLFAAYDSHDEEARSEIEKYIEHKKQSNNE